MPIDFFTKRRICFAVWKKDRFYQMKKRQPAVRLPFVVFEI